MQLQGNSQPEMCILQKKKNLEKAIILSNEKMLEKTGSKLKEKETIDKRN